MGMAIFILFTLPFHSSKEPKKNITWTVLFITFVLNVIFLAYLGQCPAESLFIKLGQHSAKYYFLFLAIIMTFINTK
jgi:quinol-cytochrome oxidoreductase complex cytochrome b subunit